MGSHPYFGHKIRNTKRMTSVFACLFSQAIYRGLTKKHHYDREALNPNVHRWNKRWNEFSWSTCLAFVPNGTLQHSVYITTGISKRGESGEEGDAKHKNATKYPFKEHFPLKDGLQICNETFQYTAWGHYVSGLALCKADFMGARRGYWNTDVYQASAFHKPFPLHTSPRYIM